MKNQPILILLSGLPASGKSIFANNLKEELIKQDKFREIVIIDIDEIRIQLFGSHFCAMNEKHVVDEKISKVKKKIQSGNVVIVDDLHYLTSMRHYFYEFCSKKDIIYISIHLSTPLNICKKWNEGRGLPIPQELIEKISKKFDVPGKKYHWDIAHFTFDPSSSKFDQIKENCINTILQRITNYNHLKINKKKLEINPKSKLQQNFDKQTRLIINTIISGTISNSHSADLDKYFNRNSPNFPKLLSIQRKKYIEWLKHQLEPKITLDTFLEFLSHKFLP